MPGGMRPGPRYNRLWRECDMTTADGVEQITTGIGAVVAAIAGRCNADKYTVLAGGRRGDRAQPYGSPERPRAALRGGAPRRRA